MREVLADSNVERHQVRMMTAMVDRPLNQVMISLTGWSLDGLVGPHYLCQSPVVQIFLSVVLQQYHESYSSPYISFTQHE